MKQTTKILCYLYIFLGMFRYEICTSHLGIVVHFGSKGRCSNPSDNCLFVWFSRFFPIISNLSLTWGATPLSVICPSCEGRRD